MRLDGASLWRSVCFLIIMYKIHCLKNGMRLVYEKMPYVRTVSVGVFVKAGSTYETEKEKGISHFIEHMLFKGTKLRSAKRIAEEMDRAGGHINAYTARECTCYYTKVLAEDLKLSADILSDMYYNSLLREEDIELERNVIIEEINMYEDSPEDIALDTTFEKMWEGNPLGNIISGSVESVSGITREMMIEYMRRRYTPENTVISVAGSFDEESMISLFEEYFSMGKNCPDKVLTVPNFKSGLWKREKDIEQTHLSIAYPGFSVHDKRIYSKSLLNGILGANMSSRLFQKIREENGLCYSIYSYTASFAQTGMLGIYAGFAEENLDKIIEMTENEIKGICREKVSEEEFSKSLSQLKCGLIMGRESNSSRMSANGKSLLVSGHIITDDEILKDAYSLTPDDIRETANEIFESGKKAVFILGVSL